MGEKIDPRREQERVTKRYAAMSDLELRKAGRDPSTLTDWAFLALREEMAKRGLDWAGSDSLLPSLMPNIPIVDDPGNVPVVVRKYRDLPPALTDRMILDTADIDCYLYEENIVRIDWPWSNLVGGVKLVVRKADAEDVEKLLNESVLAKFTVDGVGEYEQERCPNCNSMDVFCDEVKKKIAGASWLLFGLPIILVQSGWNCHACGHTWDLAAEQVAGQSEPPVS